MDKSKAEENIQLIREVMERSSRYTHFSGLSGILSGILAISGCWATYLIDLYMTGDPKKICYITTWVSILILAIGEDLILAQRKARAHGQTIFTPATCQVMKAVFPGCFVALAISMAALFHGEWNSIPAIWALGYGAALCAAGMFSIKEVGHYGVLQLITGAIALVFFSTSQYSLYVAGLTFGVYQMLFGIWITRKYH